MSHALIVVTAAEDWEAYHAIRRSVLWEARGRFGMYDVNHPDETQANHYPLLLKWNGRGVGTIRLDVRPALTIFRLVAVAADEQRKGHGRALAAHAEAFARDKGAARLVVNSAPDAVAFYRRLGFDLFSWDPAELVGRNIDSVQMSKLLRD